MTNALLTKQAFTCALKDVDRKSRMMKGAFTKYNVEDSDGDIGRKGMFTKTWSENFGRIKHLLNHDVTKPVGKIKSLYEDNEFAYYESQIGTHNLGEDVIKMAESGLLSEHSYGYNIVRQRKSDTGANELLQVKQWELTNLTGWGANQYTPLLELTKSMGKDNLSSRMEMRWKELDHFCHNTDATDDTIQALLLEIKQLQSNILILSTSSTPADDESPEPQTGEKDEEGLFLLKTSLTKLKLKLS